MKYVISILIFVSLSFTVSAQKYMTRSGHIRFFSETQVENIEAHNHQSLSILNLENGEVVFQVLMKGFQFEKALMQEHFNEKYVESDKFPKGTFEGRILDIDTIDLYDTEEVEVSVKGLLTIHGKSHPISTKGKMKMEENHVVVQSDFAINLADFEIKIPSLVKENISEEITIYVDMKYQKM